MREQKFSVSEVQFSARTWCRHQLQFTTLRADSQFYHAATSCATKMFNVQSIRNIEKPVLNLWAERGGTWFCLTEASRDTEYQDDRATYWIIGETVACDRRLFNKRINRRGDHVLFPPFHDILVTFSLRFFLPSLFPSSLSLSHSHSLSLVASARLNGLPLFCLHFIRPSCSTWQAPTRRTPFEQFLLVIPLWSGYVFIPRIRNDRQLAIATRKKKRNVPPRGYIVMETFP